MFRVSLWAALFLLASLPGCSTVPSLEETTGGQDSPVFISDVVERVKCELADAFADKFANKDYSWLQNWTAKADLTLSVNNSAGLTPSVTTTNYFKNAYNFEAGGTTFGSKTIGAISQSLTWGAGANYNEQAERAEVISFSLSIKDIVSHRPICATQLRRGLTGGLGLKEWVDSAIRPVILGQLDAGDHPAPASLSSVKAPSGAQGPVKKENLPAQPPCVGLYSVIDLKYKLQLEAVVEQVTAEVNAFSEKSTKVGTNANTLLATIADRKKAIDINTLNSKPYNGVTNINYKTAIELEKRNINTIENNVKLLYQAVQPLKTYADSTKLVMASDLENIKKNPVLATNILNLETNDEICTVGKTPGFCPNLNCVEYLKLKSNNPPPTDKDIKALLNNDIEACYTVDANFETRLKYNISKQSLSASEPVNDALCSVDGIKATKACANLTGRKNIEKACTDAVDAHTKLKNGYLAAADNAVREIAHQDVLLQLVPAPALPDPPIDSISHQVTFIVTYGANIAPNWSLAAFKGPGVNGNLASASGTRTHLLTMSIGPRTGNPKTNEEQARSIQNLNILSTRPQ